MTDMKIETLIAGAVIGVAGVLAYQYYLPCKGKRDANMLAARSADDIIGYFNGLRSANPETYLTNIKIWKDAWLKKSPEITECIINWYIYAQALA